MMPTGGLQLAGPVLPGGTPYPGGTPSPLAMIGGEEPDVDWNSASALLRDAGRSGKADPAWMVAQNAGSAPPTYAEIRQQMQEAMAQEEAAGRRAMEAYGRPPMNDMIPFMRGLSGAMGPTRTGTFGESFGAGLGQFSAGLADQEKAMQDFHRRGADLGYDIAKNRTKNVEAGLRLGLTAEQIDAAMKLAQRKMSASLYGTPAIKEFMVAEGLTPEDIEAGRLTPAQRTKFDYYVKLARGSTQMKNAASMLDPRDPQFGNMVKLLQNQPLVSKMMAIAESRHPMNAYQDQPVEVRNQAVTEEFHRLLKENAIGESAGVPIAAPPNSPQGAAGPDGRPQDAQRPLPAGPTGGSGGPAVAPAAAPAAAELPADSHVFDQYIKPVQMARNKPGVIQNEVQQAQQKAQVEAAEKSASNYLEKDVRPAIQTADDMRTSAIIAKSLLDKDPELTGAFQPFAATVGNMMISLGVKPESVQQFVTNQALFQSQATLQVLAKQMVQAGVQTEGDARRMLAAGIDPTKTGEFNRFMIRYMEAAADRMTERAAFFDRWRKRSNGSLAGAVEGWNAYSKAHPMVKVDNEKNVHFRKIELPGG